MEDFVVPLVCGLLWLLTWSVGFALSKTSYAFVKEFLKEPKGWPLENKAAFFLEFLSITTAMVAFLLVKSSHDSIHISNFAAIVGLNISVYALLMVFLVVYCYEMYRYTQTRVMAIPLSTFVIIAYVLLQFALVVLYGFNKEYVSMCLSILVLLQKSGDIYWARLRRKTL